MELFELFSKEKADFFLKLLFIKISCVVNVNIICGLLRNDWRTTKWVIYADPLSMHFSYFYRSHTQNIHPTPLSKTGV